MMAVSLKNPTNKNDSVIDQQSSLRDYSLNADRTLREKIQATRRQHVEYFAKDGGIVANMDAVTFAPRHEKTGFLHMRNKAADQLRSNCAADQRLCFCYVDSAIPLLSLSEISSL